ncbi:MAG: hypothetical protein JWQ38_2180 [Flavipsychrobacter sp.]|nr:hypothetical protein [Flavipsychrobacter sp.]
MNFSVKLSLMILSLFISVKGIGQITSSGTTLCVGTNLTLSDATPGGTWSSATSAIATVGSLSGIVTGTATGTAVISYSVGATVHTTTLTVAAKPFPLLSAPTVCVGAQRICIDSGGNIWSTSDTSILKVDSTWDFGPTVVSYGFISGVSPGAADISFTTSIGCVVTKTVTVTTAPSPIIGVGNICLGATVALSDTLAGGSWFSTNDSVATIDSLTGLLTPHAEGAVSIYYTTNCYVSGYIFVMDKPVLTTINSNGSVCVGDSIQLYSFSGSPDDTITWTSANNLLATVSYYGMLTGLSAGKDIVIFTAANICGTGNITASIDIVDCTTAVPNASTTTSQLSLSPNPNNGTFTIDLATGTSDPVRVVVTNVLGQKVADITTTTNKSTTVKIDQPSGVYMLSAFCEGHIYNTKVIVE